MSKFSPYIYTETEVKDLLSKSMSSFKKINDFSWKEDIIYAEHKAKDFKSYLNLVLTYSIKTNNIEVLDFVFEKYKSKIKNLFDEKFLKEKFLTLSCEVNNEKIIKLFMNLLDIGQIKSQDLYYQDFILQNKKIEKSTKLYLTKSLNNPLIDLF